ncbi:MAG: pilus assembly protein [Hyphomicrobiales bacterium]|nr:pilus assembly protein [Hyphomicrobiales bacterium]
MRMFRLARSPLARALLEDEGATAAVETALLAPIALSVMALLVYGAEGFAIDRKVTLTARTVTDLITQATPTQLSSGSSVVAAASIDNDLQVASAVLAPYTAANMTMVVSEVLVAANGTTATVQWSEPYNGASARPANQVVTLPGSIGTGQGGSYFILGEVYYNYAPLQLFVPLSAIMLSGAIYLTPRQSNSITCHNCATPD